MEREKKKTQKGKLNWMTGNDLRLPWLENNKKKIIIRTAGVWRKNEKKEIQNRWIVRIDENMEKGMCKSVKWEEFKVSRDKIKKVMGKY